MTWGGCGGNAQVTEKGGAGSKCSGIKAAGTSRPSKERVSARKNRDKKKKKRKKLKVNSAQEKKKENLAEKREEVNLWACK